jgi:short-subunit dehydrogenase
MKIAITGHTHGIGKTFAEQLAERSDTISINEISVSYINQRIPI